MNNNLTHVVLLLDKSGSMGRYAHDTEGGVNTFIDEQKNRPGECNFTLVEFDTNCNVVYNNVPVRNINGYSFRPSGWTAMDDAIGNTINKVGAELATLPENQRPGLVIFAILSDGEDNRSRQFDNNRIRNMIEHQSRVYNWQFTYLGANQNAILKGSRYGISEEACADFNQNKTGNTFKRMSDNVSNCRMSLASNQPVAYAYSPEDRTSMS